MKWQAEITVLLRPGVLDPQGDVVQKSLQDLGFTEVQAVRVGKYMEVILEAPDREAAAGRMDDICSRLLANPVIEDYSFRLQEVRPQ